MDPRGVFSRGRLPNWLSLLGHNLAQSRTPLFPAFFGIKLWIGIYCLVARVRTISHALAPCSHQSDYQCQQWGAVTAFARSLLIFTVALLEGYRWTVAVRIKKCRQEKHLSPIGSAGGYGYHDHQNRIARTLTGQ